MKPESLTGELAEIWDELAPTLRTDAPPPVIEALCSQVSTLRKCRKLVATDGVIVRDGKNNPIEHPALGVERSALKQIATLTAKWRKSDWDLK